MTTTKTSPVPRKTSGRGASDAFVPVSIAKRPAKAAQRKTSGKGGSTDVLAPKSAEKRHGKAAQGKASRTGASGTFVLENIAERTGKAAQRKTSKTRELGTFVLENIAKRPREGVVIVDIDRPSKSVALFKTMTQGTPTARRQAVGDPTVHYMDKPGGAAGRVTGNEDVLVYDSNNSVDEYIKQVTSATPRQLMALERIGVPGQLLKDISKRMQVPASRFFDIVGIPKATAEKKVAAGEMVTGRGGQATLGVIRLLGKAKELVDSSTAEEAVGFDWAQWLGQWIELPQPALGGDKPADLLDTPTGAAVVSRLLGSIASGAYQ